MFANSRGYADEYRRTGVSSSVLDADPHKLISLLFAGASERIRRAKASLANGNTVLKGKAIGEACAIIGHLNGSLDHEAGGEMAANLSALYDYVVLLLTQANLHNDAARLDEALQLIGEIDSAWNAIPLDKRSIGALQ